MTNYLVVQPSTMVGFETHKEAHSYYSNLPKPCGVYEVSKEDNNKVFSTNINADFHGDFKDVDCFIHLHNKLNKHNYKVSTR